MLKGVKMLSLINKIIVINEFQLLHEIKSKNQKNKIYNTLTK